MPFRFQDYVLDEHANFYVVKCPRQSPRRQAVISTHVVLLRLSNAAQQRLVLTTLEEADG